MSTKCRFPYCQDDADSSRKNQTCDRCEELWVRETCLNKFCCSGEKRMEGRRDGLCVGCHDSKMRGECRMGSCPNQKDTDPSKKDGFCRSCRDDREELKEI